MVTLLALIRPTLGGQIDFENLALGAGQNEAGQIKGRQKLGKLKFLYYSLIMICENFQLFDIK